MEMDASGAGSVMPPLMNLNWMMVLCGSSLAYKRLFSEVARGLDLPTVINDTLTSKRKLVKLSLFKGYYDDSIIFCMFGALYFFASCASRAGQGEPGQKSRARVLHALGGQE